MIVSHTHKFIFFSSSKVGTTSMERILAPYQEGSEYQFGSDADLFIPKHVPPALVRGAFPEEMWRAYFKFVFVRNPWDWFVSQWFYNTLGEAADPSSEEPSGPRLRGRLAGIVGALAGHPHSDEHPPPLAQPPTSRAALAQRRLQADDVDALFEHLQQFKGLPGRDGLYQSNWVYDMDNRMIVDFVGRYETLSTDFDRVMRRFNLDLTLPHLNRTGHDDYRVYYTDEARERVAELWAVDIEHFGYVFDPV